MDYSGCKKNPIPHGIENRKNLTMPQLLLQGFPVGASRINEWVSILEKDGQVTYFIGADSFFGHPSGDEIGQRLALTQLIENGQVRPCEVEASDLGIAHRTLMRWIRQNRTGGPGSFCVRRKGRGGAVMSSGKVAECGRLLAEGYTVPEAARQAGVNESTLRKAVGGGRVVRTRTAQHSRPAVPAATKSDRSREDAKAAEGLGTACTRADERMAAAIGMADGIATRFEPCVDVQMGGLLAGLPALCANGLLGGLDKYLSLPRGGIYSVMHLLIVTGFMGLGRIRRPEGLRHVPPGELGKVSGLDRVPEVRTLRCKIRQMAQNSDLEEWRTDLLRSWMADDPDEAGYLYMDGHVRVYHGKEANLSRRYVARQKLCLRGTTDYWINDAIGRPFFVVYKPVTEGLGATLVDDVLPRVMDVVPGQPTEAELAADPLLHRFVVVFDREGSTHSLLSKLWSRRVAAITYRKAVDDAWPESEFAEFEVPVPGGGTTRMKLASRESTIDADKQSLPVLEVRRLTRTGHQTSIVTTARTLSAPVVAGRMFARWCQENFFKYLKEHFDLDGLVEYGAEELPGTAQVVNPAWRHLDTEIKNKRRKIKDLHAAMGRTAIENDGKVLHLQAERLEEIQLLQTDIDQMKRTRRQTPRKVAISTLPESDRPTRLRPLCKMLTDTIKMIAYRAETALVALLRPHLAKEDEARALIRELFVSAADLHPDDKEKTLTVKIHRMACPAHDKAISALLSELTNMAFIHPETGTRMIYELA